MSRPTGVSDTPADRHAGPNRPSIANHQTMTTTQKSADERTRILPLVADRGNRETLETWLGSHERYQLVEETDGIGTAEFDCCILDRKTLFERRDQLLERKESENVVLPYLLLVPRSAHTEIRDRLRNEHRELWEQIDGIVDMPIAGDRLAEQLENVVRLREQSITAHRRRAQLRQIRDQHTGHGVLLVDTDGTIEYVNEALERQSGYASTELLGRNPRILKSGAHSQSFYEELWETILAGEVWDGTVINERKNGDRYVVDQTIAPVPGPDGEIQQFVGINHEITELKQMEERLRDQREQLEVLNRVLRHDIRNDMEIVLTWTELLEEEVSDVGREYLDRILRAGEHVVELTTVSRDLSEIISEDESPDLERVSLERVLASELEKRREAFEDAEIAMPEPPRPGTDVLANELLSSVFRNLINNAVQHNDSDAPAVSLTVEEREETVSVRVADNGPGIPDGMKERLFGEGEKGLESDGTGIGLFLVRNLVESYGGDVRVEDRRETPSKEGGDGGAVFVVTLPKPAEHADNEVRAG